MKAIRWGVLLFLFLIPSAQADIVFTNGLWTTTFNCAEQTWPPGDVSNCDGIVKALDGAYASSITSAANFSGGAGGRGFLWKIGTDGSPSPIGSNLAFTWSGANHLWIRWYVRIPPGLSIGYEGPNIYGWKVLYLYNAAWNSSFYVNANYNGGGMSLYDGVSTRHNRTYGISDALGTTTSNGAWVGIEMEFDLQNGIWRYWIYAPGAPDHETPDGSATGVNYPIALIQHIRFPENITSAGISGAPVDLYLDDVAINLNGRNGPLGASPTPTPTPTPTPPAGSVSSMGGTFSGILK